MSSHEQRLEPDTMLDPSSTVGPSAAASRAARARSTAWSPSLTSLLSRPSASSTTATLSEDDTRRTPGRTGSNAYAGGARKRARTTTDWLLVVKPPTSLPHSPPPPGTSAFASAYGPPSRFSDGTLMPLQTTLSSQVALIARDYGFPSVAGLCVYVDIGYGTAPHDVNQTVRATEEAWATLWRPYLSAEAVVLQLPIAGRIEFDIDLRRARWFCEWCSPSSGHLSTQRNHPSESTRHRTSSTFSEMALEPSRPSGFDALASTPNASPSVSKLSYTRGTSTASSPSLSVSHSPPRPEALPASLLSIQGDSEKKDPNWTEQLNQLREIREHDLVEGLDHPSQIDSLDGTQSLGEIYAALTSTESSEHDPALAVDVPQIAKDSHPLPPMLGPPFSPMYRTEYPVTHWYDSGLYNPVHHIVIVSSARGQEKIQHAVLSAALDNKRTDPPATCNARVRPDNTEAVHEEELPYKLLKPSERVSKGTKEIPRSETSQQRTSLRATSLHNLAPNTLKSSSDVAFYSPLPSPTIRPSPSLSFSGSSSESHFDFPLPPVPSKRLSGDLPESASELRSAQRAFYAEPEFSDDDEDEHQVEILFSCDLNVEQPLADDDEDGSQSEPDLEEGNIDEGENGCQVFDLCTASDIERRPRELTGC